MILKRRCRVLLFLWLALPWVSPARAQLTDSLYSVTEIRTRVLPNAVQLTIQTDGAPIYGTDLNDFVDSETGSTPKQVSSLRLRLVSARSRIPALVDIGAYPVDSVLVTPGRTELVNPYFSTGGYQQAEPRVDIEFQFYVPVTVRRFGVEINNPGYSFGNELGPRDLAVERGLDGRSIVITVVPDRFDIGRGDRWRRAPSSDLEHRFEITPDATGTRFRFDILHMLLGDVLPAVSRRTRTPLVPLANTANTDISLVLPAATLDDFLSALTAGYNLGVTARPLTEGGGFAIGRRRESAVLARIALHNTAPQQARLWFPDFLLPRLRVDKENNALIVSGTPELVERVRRDVARFDQPRPQTRVEVRAWEFDDTRTADYALSTALKRSWGSLAFDSAPGELTLRLEPPQQHAFEATVQALVSRGRARLAAQPYLIITAGEEGTLFVGQKRLVNVLQVQGGQQNLDTLELPIGTSLSAKPRAGAGDEITLELKPRISTVDAVEPDTGLPTLGVRESNSTVRVRSGDTIIVAGLDNRLEFTEQGRLSHRADRRWSSLIMLVTVKKV